MGATGDQKSNPADKPGRTSEKTSAANDQAGDKADKPGRQTEQDKRRNRHGKRPRRIFC